MIGSCLKPILAVALVLAAAAAEAGTVELVRAYQVQGGFANEDGGVGAKDLSGLACTALPARHCLAVNDENQTAQFATIEDGRIATGAEIRLVGKDPSPATLGTAPQVTTCPEGAKKFGEFDGEAVAYAAPHFYVVGSHGCGRNNDAFRLSSFILARIRVDAQARPVDAQGAGSANAVQTTYRLSDLLRRAPVVGSAFGKSLNQADGLNIEGLAVAGDRLMVGLRAPAKDKAHIVTASIADLFAPGNAPSTATPEVIPVELGANTGIRDLAPVGERLLILSGPTQEQANVPYGLFLIEPKAGAKVMPIASIPDVIEDGKRAKAEALTVLEVQGDTLRVLILFDGLPNGGPREYKVSLK